MDLPPRSDMRLSHADSDAQPPPYTRSSSTDVDHIFGFMPPEDSPLRGGTTWSRPVLTQSSGMTDVGKGPVSFSSHSRALTTPPTATSTSFPITPRSNGPCTPFTPTWDSNQEHRFDTIQSRTTSMPSTGGSGGMMFSFRPPTQDSAPLPPTTASQLSSITELTSQGSLRLDDGAKSEEFMPSAPNTAGSSRLSKKLADSAASLTAAVPSTRSRPAGPALQALDLDDEEDSPYAEVRASVSNIDDPDMPCLTWRTWVIGLILCVLSSGSQMFFYLRYPSPSFGYPVTIICVFVCGKALERLPIRSWQVGGITFDLNPGPFNVKEHTAAFILSSVSADVIWPLDFIMVAEKKYLVKSSLCFHLLLSLSCQLIGFSFGGICRRILVRPASLIWPTNLSTCALVNMFHAGDGETRRGRKVSQLRFFVLITLGSAAYSFLPSLLFTGLSYFSFLCWIWPDNRVVNQLFGTVTGLGMSGITFDWNQVSFVGNPLVMPWWASVHLFAGFVLFYWILSPLLYYLDVWKTGHLPMMGYSAYDRFARPYSIDRVIDEGLMRLNSTAYEEYSGLYLPVTFAVTYTLAFIAPMALLTHTALHYGPSIFQQLRRGTWDEQDDVHAKLMRRYPDTPTWWYFVLFGICFAALVAAFKVQPAIDTPIWVIPLALAIALVFLFPAVHLFAMTGRFMAFNLIVQIIPGALLPGRPLANMMFKIIALDSLLMGQAFTCWLKLGHYMKVPPRANFYVQIVGSIVSITTQVGVKYYLFTVVPDICEQGQKSQLTCPTVGTVFTASVVWGMIGPARLYGRNGLYFPQTFGFLIGAFLPLPFWWWSRRRPKSLLSKFHLPTFFISHINVPPATGINEVSFFLTGFIFQYLLRKKRTKWWSRYNYILGGALEAGTIIGLILLLLAVQLPQNGKLALNWWGNRVWQNTADANGVPFYSTDPVNGFAGSPKMEHLVTI